MNNPGYGDYVRRQMALLGEHHPFIRTEYELEELDGAGGLFPADRQQLIQGDFPPETGPADGAIHALVIDIAGEEEQGLEGELVRRARPTKDSTAVAVVRIVPGQLPRFEVVAFHHWTGTRHTTLHERIRQLAAHWKVHQVVIDATGIGAGLASFLRESLGERVVTPFVFSSSRKSQLAWDLLGLIDSGRLQVFDDRLSDGDQRRLAALFQQQLAACRYTVLPGPGRLLKWGVEDEKVHDDLLMAVALVAVLQRRDWRSRAARGR